jgi:hypothetical protein
MDDRDREHVWVEAENSLRHAISRDRPGTFMCGRPAFWYRSHPHELKEPADDLRCARCDRALERAGEARTEP